MYMCADIHRRHGSHRNKINPSKSRILRLSTKKRDTSELDQLISLGSVSDPAVGLRTGVLQSSKLVMGDRCKNAFVVSISHDKTMSFNINLKLYTVNLTEFSKGSEQKVSRRCQRKCQAHDKGLYFAWALADREINCPIRQYYHFNYLDPHSRLRNRAHLT